MFGTNALELLAGGREARVSTEGLFRVIEVPSGRVVADLLDEDHAVDAVGSREQEIETDGEDWHVAVAYPLLAALELAGVSVADVTIKTGPLFRCYHCESAPVGRWQKDVKDLGKNKFLDDFAVLRWSCGTTRHNRRPAGQQVKRTDECIKREAEWLGRVDVVNANVQGVLTRAGIAWEMTNARNYGAWVLDGRHVRYDGLVISGPTAEEASHAAPLPFKSKMPDTQPFRSAAAV